MNRQFSLKPITKMRRGLKPHQETHWTQKGKRQHNWKKQQDLMGIWSCQPKHISYTSFFFFWSHNIFPVEFEVYVTLLQGQDRKLIDQNIIFTQTSRPFSGLTIKTIITFKNARAHEAREERDLAAAFSNALNLLASMRAFCSSDIRILPGFVSSIWFGSSSALDASAAITSTCTGWAASCNVPEH